MPKYHVVIPAAGQGKRMNAGKNKQLLMINHVPLLIHTLRVFEEDLLCSEIILAVNEHEKEVIWSLIKDYQLTKVTKVVIGGKERQQSVYEGLKVIQGNPIVLIHDGARPFIRKETIHQLIAKVDEEGAAVVAVPVKDTIKQVSQNQITATIDRSSLWSIQTPQAFHLEEITYAHEVAVKEEVVGTDDASLLEYMNRPVSIVQGDYENFKVTTPEDLLFAEAIIEKRKGETN
ncbi:2-C-methyl-D-erythritol 4-phosphate cytidylyltransferase [Salipaludibacillus daqingensis]|uniref:2-C-methyl-D-erythritol 4-phosphate cytidylyltransferase n=1 Tax=Salipaludibacillus daqingensis TaxID=3041001 RepID=UPI0024737068|nr:2-C-methyl-D-erythritol 4-phosphate cytidylyltransferase [Salipaludibacillus daqingensis]